MTARQQGREKERGFTTTKKQGRDIQKRNECNGTAYSAVWGSTSTGEAVRALLLFLRRKVGDPSVFGMELGREGLGKVR